MADDATDEQLRANIRAIVEMGYRLYSDKREDEERKAAALEREALEAIQILVIDEFEQEQTTMRQVDTDDLSRHMKEILRGYGFAFMEATFEKTSVYLPDIQ